MSPDDLQQAWQAESSRTRVTVDADVLLKSVQGSQHRFRAMIFARDLREAGIALLMLPLWFVLGYAISPPWTWYLSVPGLIWIIAFIVVDRRRHRQRRVGPDEPLLSSVAESLKQVEHQIWLLRNVLWWYLLPLGVPLVAFFVHVSWLTADSWVEALASGSVMTVFVLVLYVFIYWLNQYAVRKQLEPRRQELSALLASLGDETAEGVNGEFPILTAASRKPTWRRTIIGVLCALVLLAVAVDVIYILANLDSRGRYAKLAPFTDVRWSEDAPVIEIDGQNYLLYSIDGIPVKDIAAFCKQTYKDKWQKRFAEDLVEVMTAMGHAPGETVKLDVISVAQPAGRIIKEVPMTAANRNAVRREAERREEFEAWNENSDREKNQPSTPLSELVPALRKESKLVGLAAMVMVDGKVVESAADGERKSGSDVAVTVEDQWHLGSITKSITATMIARLVEAGKMNWDDTIGEIFPDAPMHEEWKVVTLRQLLTHTSGAPANFGISVRRQQPAIGIESSNARRAAVLDAIADKPENKPGTTHAYSNLGYTIAGAMAEQATGETWDALVTREVFEPLSLASAGFGPPKSVDTKFEQPQGHTSVFGWKVGTGEDVDNTFIIGPAGIVHMKLEDLCTYATEHLRGERGEGKLLKAETYTQLHKPELDDYACGWVKVEARPTIPHMHYWHNGSNTMWYALVVFIPDTNMVVAVASNDGDIANAESAAWKIVENSVKSPADGTPK